MIGLFGYNMFNQYNNTGRELWAMTLRQGGGNPGMKVNPIYVKKNDELAETIEAETVVEENKEPEETENKPESEEVSEEGSLEKKED